MNEEEWDRALEERRRKEAAANKKLIRLIAGMFFASFVAAITFVLIVIWAVKHL